MKEDNATILSEIGPDLFVPPHVLPILMELFAGEKQKAFLPQEQLLIHLVSCQYCRTAVLVLLDIAQEYDRRNNDPEEPVYNLRVRFASISRVIETCEDEQLGAYAEAIVVEGQDKADLRFPDVVIHLRNCPDCHSALKATISFITEAEEPD